MAKITKRTKAFEGKVDPDKLYNVEEASEGAKACATAKFDETVELAFLLGVDPRHADQMVRGSVSLPHGTGKTARVVVFCKQADQVAAAEAAGAEAVGA